MQCLQQDVPGLSIIIVNKPRFYKFMAWLPGKCYVAVKSKMKMFAQFPSI